jgi:hypothetical protein
MACAAVAPALVEVLPVLSSIVALSLVVQQRHARSVPCAGSDTSYTAT